VNACFSILCLDALQNLFAPQNHLYFSIIFYLVFHWSLVTVGSFWPIRGLYFKLLLILNKITRDRIDSFRVLGAFIWRLYSAGLVTETRKFLLSIGQLSLLPNWQSDFFSHKSPTKKSSVMFMFVNIYCFCDAFI